MNRFVSAALAFALAFTPLAALADHDRGRGRGHERDRARNNPFAPIDVAGMGTLDGEPITRGTLSIVGFVIDESGAAPTLQAVGILTAQSASHGITNETVRIPVQNGLSGAADTGRIGIAQFRPPACDVLNLVLGPLDLNLLGLQVDLAQVVLDITAQPGAGNLLGNLLCAVVSLLDAPGAIAAAIQTLGNLNTLVALLGL